MVKSGERVEQNQPLLRLSSPELELEVARLEASAKLAQQDALIRQADVYADLFTHAAMAASAAVAKAMDGNPGGTP